MPLWPPDPSALGVITIGVPVTDGIPNAVLFCDPAGRLANEENFKWKSVLDGGLTLQGLANGAGFGFLAIKPRSYNPRFVMNYAEFALNVDGTKDPVVKIGFNLGDYTSPKDPNFGGLSDEWEGHVISATEHLVERHIVFHDKVDNETRVISIWGNVDTNHVQLGHNAHAVYFSVPGSATPNLSWSENRLDLIGTFGVRKPNAPALTQSNLADTSVLEICRIGNDGDGNDAVNLSLPGAKIVFNDTADFRRIDGAHSAGIFNVTTDTPVTTWTAGVPSANPTKLVRVTIGGVVVYVPGWA